VTAKFFSVTSKLLATITRVSSCVELYTIVVHPQFLSLPQPYSEIFLSKSERRMMNRTNLLADSSPLCLCRWKGKDVEHFSYNHSENGRSERELGIDIEVREEGLDVRRYR
jgi:hypothetical protein